MPRKHLNQSEILRNFGGIAQNDLNKILPSIDIECDVNISSFSPYVSELQLPQYVNTLKDNLSVLTLNCQSLNAKFDKLQVMIQNLIHENKLQFSIILLQETWLKPSDEFEKILSTFNIPGYKKPFGIPASCSNHGGLVCFVKETLEASVCYKHITSNFWEGIFLRITGKSIKPTLVGNIYRPPRNNNNNRVVDDFLHEFLPTISKLSEKYTSAILSGDFNINLLKINEREKYALFLDSMLSLGFVPKINLPTRFSKNSASLLDR